MISTVEGKAAMRRARAGLSTPRLRAPGRARQDERAAAACKRSELMEAIVEDYRALVADETPELPMFIEPRKAVGA